MSLISKTHQEEITKLRLEYENKMDNLIKHSEEEKIDLNQINDQLQKENFALYNKLNSIDHRSDKNEFIEYQRKYISEMKTIQKDFAASQDKTAKEVR